MYLFVFAYPFIVLCGFIVLDGVELKDIKDYFKSSFLLLIAPLPIIAILLRVIRSAMENPLLSSYFLLQFIYVVLLPLGLFCYYYYILIKVYYSNLATMDYKEMGASHILHYLNSRIIIIVLSNELLLSSLSIIVNNMFFNWIDILLVPLVRMAVAQSIILIGIQGTKGFLEYLEFKSIQVIIKAFSYIMIFIIISILGTLALKYYAVSFFVYAHTLLIFTIVTGWGCVNYLGREFKIVKESSQDYASTPHFF